MSERVPSSRKCCGALDVLHQQVVGWFARLDARHHHPTRSVLSKPCALLSLCEELREVSDGRAFRRSIENRRSTGSAAVVTLGVLSYPSRAPTRRRSCNGRCYLRGSGWTMHSNHEVHFALCMLCDIGDSLHIRCTLTRTIYELVPCRKRQRLNLTFSLLCRLSSKPSPKSCMTVFTTLSHVEAQLPIQGNSRPMMRLARSSFPRSCASERPKGARTNIGGRKQAQGEGTQPGV